MTHEETIASDLLDHYNIGSAVSDESGRIDAHAGRETAVVVHEEAQNSQLPMYGYATVGNLDGSVLGAVNRSITVWIKNSSSDMNPFQSQSGSVREGTMGRTMESMALSQSWVEGVCTASDGGLMTLFAQEIRRRANPTENDNRSFERTARAGAATLKSTRVLSSCSPEGAMCAATIAPMTASERPGNRGHGDEIIQSFSVGATVPAEIHAGNKSWRSMEVHRVLESKGIIADVDDPPTASAAPVTTTTAEATKMATCTQSPYTLSLGILDTGGEDQFEGRVEKTEAVATVKAEAEIARQRLLDAACFQEHHSRLKRKPATCGSVGSRDDNYNSMQFRECSIKPSVSVSRRNEIGRSGGSGGGGDGADSKIRIATVFSPGLPTKGLWKEKCDNEGTETTRKEDRKRQEASMAAAYAKAVAIENIDVALSTKTAETAAAFTAAVITGNDNAAWSAEETNVEGGGRRRRRRRRRAERKWQWTPTKRRLAGRLKMWHSSRSWLPRERQRQRVQLSPGVHHKTNIHGNKSQNNFKSWIRGTLIKKGIRKLR